MIFLVLNTEEEVLLVEAIYNKYSKFIFKTAYNVLHNSYDAEDAVQQVLIKIIDNLDKIGDINDKKTRNFIGIISRNTAINIYNKSKKIVALEEDDIQAEERDVSLIIIDKESVERVENFIYNLDDIYREVILLKTQYGYSINEIANILDIKPKTVQKRLERGRIKIKEFLNKDVKRYE